ncbi:S-adenosyl-L-methionine-dependent methyltransferase [Roridomyces roridus]|uniref:S-adenosyl-L-methionine-dependent methyltransferase n=1 Tax=Roridomyces roridus TaxID=1738132 RepID=A0AAD7FF11_9AGAR|nr:S-adenosyl-L-methionine-dependent methyltransferase [Roridomyces roridus]
MPPLNHLRQLAELILESVTTLERISQETNAIIPTLDDTDISAPQLFNATAEAITASRVIAAAGIQLAALTRDPHEAMFDTVHEPYKGAALRVCLEGNVSEILRDAGPERLHADEIAAEAHIDGAKLARIMRYLASHHIYREISPGTFVNNRLSAVLDTGKPVDELFAKPESKHSNTSGFAAMASFILGLGTAATTQLWETISNPATAFSSRVLDSALHRAQGLDVPLWVTFEQPGREPARQLFEMVMRAYNNMQPASAVLEAYPWSELQPGSVIVDVGGGVGWAMLPVAKAHPHLRIVIQDSEKVVKDGINNWNAELPEALLSERVTFQAHDFFTAQNVKNASAFFMRYILHDWPDEDVRRILEQLRHAAEPHTVLVILDHILPFTFRDSSFQYTLGNDAPEPLLPTYGAANTMGYLEDVLMMVNLNGKERTVAELETLLASTGWKLKQVQRVEGTVGFFLPIHAVPV